MIRWELSPFHRFAPVDVFAAFLAALVVSVRSRAALRLEVLALRHQLGVLQRSVKRPTLTSSDRLFSYMTVMASSAATSSIRSRPLGCRTCCRHPSHPGSARSSKGDRGYVYLPGRGDDAFDLNTRTIFRGREGH